MQSYEVYKNIRKRAVLFGLPLSMFALMMCAIICSLMIIIFSFSLLVLLGVPVFNVALYFTLLNLNKLKSVSLFGSRFPKHLSNKKTSIIPYDEA